VLQVFIELEEGRGYEIIRFGREREYVSKVDLKKYLSTKKRGNDISCGDRIQRAPPMC